MHLLNNLRLGLRMALGFGSVLLLLALVVALAATRFGAMERATDELVNDTWVKAEAVNELEKATRANGTRTLELLLTTEPARLAYLRERIAANRERATAALGTLDRLVRLPDGRRLLAEIVALRGRYVQSFRRVDAELAAGRRAGALLLAQEQTLPLLEQLQERTRALAQRQAGMAQQAGTAAHAGVRGDLQAVLALGAAALVLGGVLALVLTRSITVPLAQALAMAQRIAEGDLTAHLRVQRRDEIGALLAAMGDMNTRLARVVGAVRGNAESVATASAQIAQGNLDLSQRTEEQASALEQTAASMEQLGSAVEHNAANAQAAHRLADNASAVAALGGEAVAQVVGTMDEIQRGSHRIRDIIGTIDGIALQTNILALNAAVEAARAGEQGRGFAVVSAEVRSLAQRCAAAAREIKGLITANLEQVDSGNAQVQAAGLRMGDVVAAIRQVTQTVEQISAASSQQSAGVGQVGEAVGQMDQVTQQNAALVEQSAAAAESLRQQAEQLVRAVAAFRLEPEAVTG